MIITELREGVRTTSNAFSLARNVIVFIAFLKLGGSGGTLPQKNF